MSVFNYESDLINQINENLEEQRTSGIKEEDLYIRIKKYEKNTISFHFSLIDIINKLNLPLNKENKKESSSEYEINYAIDFYGTIFNSTVHLFNFRKYNKYYLPDSGDLCIFNKPVYLNESKFNDEVNLSNSRFNDILDFNNSNFISNTYFLQSNFNNEVNFSKSIFESIISFSSLGDYLFKCSANFSNSKFNSDTIFSGLFISIANFSGSIFYYKTNFEYAKFDAEVNFSGSIFLKEVFFPKFFNCTVNFSDSKFKTKVNFSDTQFIGKVIFKKTEFIDEVLFERVTFNNIIDFSDSKICNNLILKHIEVKDKLVDIIFNSIKLENENSHLYMEMFSINHINKISFENTTINNVLSMKNIKSDNIEIKNSTLSGKIEIDNIESVNTIFLGNIISGVLSMRNIKSDNIEIQNSIISGRVEIQNLESNNTNFYGTAITGIFNAILYNFGELKNSETARFFKHEAMKINDTIKALKYKAQEVNLYKNELWVDLKKDKSIQKIAEFVSISINGFFSNHGQNWVQAAGCTLFLGFLFYSTVYVSKLYISFSLMLAYSLIHIFYLYISSNLKEMIIHIINTLLLLFTFLLMKENNIFTELNCFFNGLIKYFIPLDFKFIDTNNSIANTILIFGKIATWYGGAQVISSFRKYNKY